MRSVVAAPGSVLRSRVTFLSEEASWGVGGAGPQLKRASMWN